MPYYRVKWTERRHMEAVVKASSPDEALETVDNEGAEDHDACHTEGITDTTVEKITKAEHDLCFSPPNQ